MTKSVFSISAFALVLLAEGVVWSAPAKPKALPEAALRRTLESILTAPELDDASVGVHVRDLETGKTVFSRNASKLFNPASNVKIVTTAAALSYLGPSYRFTTTAYRDRNLHGGVVQGNLYIKGRGDPTLTNEALFGFVNEIALRGIERINGDLIVDDTFFDKVYEGPGWEQERSDQSYAPPMSALSVNFGTFSIRVMPGDSVGSEAKVFVWPDIPMFEVVGSVSTRGSGARGRVFVGTTQEEDKIRVTVRGAVPINDIFGVTVYKRVYEPTLYAGQVIRQMLEMRGIKVRGRVKLGQVPRGGVVPVANNYSAPLAEITSTLNKHSNNFIAEQLLKTMGAELKEGPGSWERGVAAASDFLAEIGIPRGAYVMGNGSGLNDINRFTPEQITMILQTMHRRFEVRPEFVASLAVAGKSGTINARFSDKPADSRLRAKTGSLTGVSALSGFVVTRENHLLAFSVMMNGYRGGARPMREVQNRIGNALAELEGAPVIAQPDPRASGSKEWQSGSSPKKRAN